MGDRANIIVAEQYDDNNTKGVVLYTHWAGTALPTILAEALRRGRERWDDGAYLTRIIFAQMTAEEPLGLTGYGISAEIGDNEHPYLVVDVARGVVVTVKPKPWAERLADVLARAAYAKGVSFDDFITKHGEGN